MIFDINDIAKIGSIQDVPAYMLPPEAWTVALNMRYMDDGLETLEGWGQIFGTPGVAPHFLLPVSTESNEFTLYTSLTKAFVYDGSTHTDITRTVGGDYTATDSSDWNGTILGGIPVLNNGKDVPQFWGPLTIATPLQPLTAWDTNKRAKVIRAFGPQLIAFNITDTGQNLPHRVLWSHTADPGTLPDSWDPSDPTKDTGEVDLPDVNTGKIVDALPLGNYMYIYKESAVWRMRFVGGQSIYDFGQSAWLQTPGLLGPRSVGITGDGTKHVFATQDDIMWHDGSNVQSILNRRQRRRLQNEMDQENYNRSFMMANPFNNEMWFCYPQAGSAQPDRALIMNYKFAGNTEFVVTEADGITFRYGVVGNTSATGAEIWDTGTDTWDDDTGPWQRFDRRRLLLASPDNTKIYAMGTSLTRDGETISTILRREGLALIGKKRNGELIVDHQRWKLFKRMWPKITGDDVVIKFGYQTVVDGPITWLTPQSYDPTSMTYADPGPTSGRAVGIEITGTGNWRIDGYKLDMEAMGEY